MVKVTVKVMGLCDDKTVSLVAPYIGGTLGVCLFIADLWLFYSVSVMIFSAAAKFSGWAKAISLAAFWIKVAFTHG